eukprot:Polyplicarium_translucidae@DN3279_c0_g1_i2.p1
MGPSSVLPGIRIQRSRQAWLQIREQHRECGSGHREVESRPLRRIDCDLRLHPNERPAGASGIPLGHAGGGGSGLLAPLCWFTPPRDLWHIVPKLTTSSVPPEYAQWQAAQKFDLEDLGGTRADLLQLGFDRSPLFVLEDTPLEKVHFLMTMLSLGQLLVVDSHLHVKGTILESSFSERERNARRANPPPPLHVLRRKVLEMLA